MREIPRWKFSHYKSSVVKISFGKFFEKILKQRENGFITVFRRFLSSSGAKRRGKMKSLKKMQTFRRNPYENENNFVRFLVQHFSYILFPAKIPPVGGKALFWLHLRIYGSAHILLGSAEAVPRALPIRIAGRANG